MGLNKNGTHEVLAYMDHENLIGDDIRITKKIRTWVNECLQDIGLAVYTGKTKYMKVGRDRGKMAN